MKKKSLILFLLFSLIFSYDIYSQITTYAFNTLATSRFSKAIRLGNAYTGIADGAEATFYNPSGIANEDKYSFVFSSGHGYFAFWGDITAYDMAFVAPVSEKFGSIGLSVNYFGFEFEDQSNYDAIYTLHYAKAFNNFSFGLSLHDYVSKFDVNMRVGDNVVNSPKGDAIDLSLSALYSAKLGLTDDDRFRIGLQIRNLLDTKLEYKELKLADYKYQNIRAGFSYKVTPNLNKISQLDPLSFLVSFDAVFEGTDYEYTTWQPNYALELTLLEILQLSYGRENELELKDVYYENLSVPVSRYGFGINIPFEKLSNVPLDLSLNYSYSDWQKIDESNEFYIVDRPLENQSSRSSFSLGLRYKF